MPLTLSIPAVATTVGATVGALTYTSIAEAGNATATLTETGAKVVGFLAGEGVELAVGTTAGELTRLATVELSHNYLSPAIRKGSKTGAILGAAVAGTAATLATTAVIHVGESAIGMVQRYQQRRCQQPDDSAADDYIIESTGTHRSDYELVNHRPAETFVPDELEGPLTIR